MSTPALASVPLEERHAAAVRMLLPDAQTVEERASILVAVVWPSTPAPAVEPPGAPGEQLLLFGEDA